MSRYLWLPFCLLTACRPAQPITESSATAVLELPFRLRANQTLLPIRVNGSRPLNLILDTGMAFDGVLVYDPSLRDSIELVDQVAVQVPGAGSGPPSVALMSDSGRFSCGGWTRKEQRVIVLQDPTMRGLPSDGVIGWSLFGHYAVELDYDSLVLRLHQPGWQPSDSAWVPVELWFKDNLIPWTTARVNTRGDRAVEVDLYIDFASGDAVELMVKPGAKFELPDSLEEAYLGTGLSGDIHGHRGQVAWIELAGFRFEQVEASLAPEEVRSKQKDADAAIGSGLLSQFNLVFDYSDTSRARLWLRPNARFGDPF